MRFPNCFFAVFLLLTGHIHVAASNDLMNISEGVKKTLVPIAKLSEQEKAFSDEPASTQNTVSSPLSYSAHIARELYQRVLGTLPRQEESEDDEVVIYFNTDLFKNSRS